MQVKFYVRLFAVVALLLAGSAQAQRFVCMESTQGNWCVELQWSAAPRTVANFLQYVNGGYYTNNLIHRSAASFVIQGGGFTISPENETGTVPTYPPIALEYSLPNERGTMAMARTQDINSATSQWFVNTVDNTNVLGISNNGGYAVFARVVQGMEVIDKIASLKTLNASSLIPAWDTLPLDPPAGVTSIPVPIPRQYYVLINRAYATDLLPGTTPAAYHCSTPIADETLTEVCSGAVTFPVQVEGVGMYEVTIQLISDTPKYVLQLTGAKALTTTPAVYATYNQTNKLLQIPSVRVGITAYVNVTLQLTKDSPMQFTLQNLTPR